MTICASSTGGAPLLSAPISVPGALGAKNLLPPVPKLFKLFKPFKPFKLFDFFGLFAAFIPYPVAVRRFPHVPLPR